MIEDVLVPRFLNLNLMPYECWELSVVMLQNFSVPFKDNSYSAERTYRPVAVEPLCKLKKFSSALKMAGTSESHLVDC